MHLSLLKSFANHKWTHISTFLTWQKYVGKYVLPNLHCFAFSWFTWFVPDFQMSPMKGNSIKEEVNYTIKETSPKFCKSDICVLNRGQGPSLYYVLRVFWPFLNHLPHYVRTFSVHKVKENHHSVDKSGWIGLFQKVFTTFEKFFLL